MLECTIGIWKYMPGFYGDICDAIHTPRIPQDVELPGWLCPGLGQAAGPHMSACRPRQLAPDREAHGGHPSKASFTWRPRPLCRTCR